MKQSVKIDSFDIDRWFAPMHASSGPEGAGLMFMAEMNVSPLSFDYQLFPICVYNLEAKKYLYISDYYYNPDGSINDAHLKEFIEKSRKRIYSGLARAELTEMSRFYAPLNDHTTELFFEFLL